MSDETYHYYSNTVSLWGNDIMINESIVFGDLMKVAHSQII